MSAYKARGSVRNKRVLSKAEGAGLHRGDILGLVGAPYAKGSQKHDHLRQRNADIFEAVVFRGVTYRWLAVKYSLSYQSIGYIVETGFLRLGYFLVRHLG